MVVVTFMPFPLAVEHAHVFVLSLGPFFCFFLSSWVATGTGTTCLDFKQIKPEATLLLPPSSPPVLWLASVFSWLHCPLGRHTSLVLQGSHSGMNGTVCSSTAAWQVLVLASHWQTSSRRGYLTGLAWKVCLDIPMASTIWLGTHCLIQLHFLGGWDLCPWYFSIHPHFTNKIPY